VSPHGSFDVEMSRGSWIGSSHGVVSSVAAVVPVGGVSGGSGSWECWLGVVARSIGLVGGAGICRWMKFQMVFCGGAWCW